MARPVSVRPNLDHDVKFFLTSKEAISKDPGLEREWKEAVCELLQRLAMLYLNPKRVQESEDSPKGLKGKSQRQAR